jgi:L-ascorbate metabolism protein UlaG (beta-lactamase superfamily)
MQAQLPSASSGQSEAGTDGRKHQAKAPQALAFGGEAFEASQGTCLRWLGMAGFLINSRGTTIMVDPVLVGFDMPLLIEMPIAPEEVPTLDAILVTHSDNDHYSIPTCRSLAPVTASYHSTQYVASLLNAEGFPAHGHAVGDSFTVGAVRVDVKPADHAWQNASPGASTRRFNPEDACGFWLETPDGTIWAPGDSRLIPEHHLRMPAPDALLFDFSDSDWHFGFDGAVQMANAYPATPLLLHHWGSVDAPGFAPFNADPGDLTDAVTNPSRIHLLAPGEPFALRRLKGPTETR